MIFDYNKVMYVSKKYEKTLALFIIFATIDSLENITATIASEVQ